LKDSIQAFCHGGLGSMNMHSVPFVAHHSATTGADELGPLSKRMNAGARPRSVARRSNTATTSSAVIECSTRMSRHSRVNSSMTLRIFTCRWSMVWSNLRSSAHKAFGAMRLTAPTWVPPPVWCLFFVLVGT
jgi:hypothetical protein